MKIDRKGNIYVAQCFGGKILKISPGGKLMHVFQIAAGDGTTNVAFGAAAAQLRFAPARPIAASVDSDQAFDLQPQCLEI